MQYQRQLSAGKVNHEEELKTKELLKNCQRLLKTITVKNPFAEYLSLPNSVFKPRRTNAHYLQFIEIITFYKQYQKFHHIDKETGEEYIETSIEDIQEANELIKEVLLRKSDILTGKSRNMLELLKQKMQEDNQVNFTNGYIRRKLRIPKSSVQRRLQEWQDVEIIKKQTDKKTKSYWYEIIHKTEYKVLESLIDDALTKCIDQINRPINPKENTKYEPIKIQYIKTLSEIDPSTVEPVKPKKISKLNPPKD